MTLDFTPRADEDEQLRTLAGFDIVMMMLAFFMGLSIYLYLNKKPTKAEFDEISGKYATLLQATGYTDQEVKAKVKYKKPPLITLSAADGFSFPSSTAIITKDFHDKLQGTIIPDIIARANEHGLDLVEVVGHTDEVPINSHGKTNLDQWLIPLLQGKVNPDTLTAVDNTGLAMMRAVVVSKLLVLDDRIQAAKLTVVPLSAGQLIRQDGKPSDGGSWTDAGRRRIDLRLRRLRESVEATAAK